MLKLDLLTKFSVNDKVIDGSGAEKFEPLLEEGENILLHYKAIRDRVVFTDRKIITYDVQGITGSKKEYRVFPYSNFVIRCRNCRDSGWR